MLLAVTSTARTLRVSSSIPRFILRQIRRFGPLAARQHMYCKCERELSGVLLTFTFALDLNPVLSQLTGVAAIGQAHVQALLAAPPKPSRDQTRSTAIHAASSWHCKPASS